MTTIDLTEQDTAEVEAFSGRLFMAGLEALEAQPFEQTTLLRDGAPPLLVVVREIELVSRRPAALWLRQA